MKTVLQAPLWVRTHLWPDPDHPHPASASSPGSALPYPNGVGSRSPLCKSITLAAANLDGHSLWSSASE